MILTTHAVTGAALASLFPHQPVIGFLAAFASHYVLDAIPHWDYPILTASLKPNIGGKLRLEKSLLIDFTKLGSDALLGLLLATLFFAPLPSVFPALLGAIGGLLPDFLQFVYTRFRREPLSSLQRFHRWVHSKKKITSFIGIAIQAFFILSLIILLKQ